MKGRGATGKTLAAIAVAVVISFVLAMAGVAVLSLYYHTNPIIATVFKVKIFVATFTAVLLLVLLYNYTSIYREMPNRFTLSLLVFSVSLLFYALSSNPVIHIFFGFRGASLGPFTFLPDMFASIAVIVLLYQSFE